MARKAASQAANSAGAASRGEADRSRKFDELGKETSEVVQRAAAVLEEELAVGVVAAKEIGERFRAERRFDEATFMDAVERLQRDAHEVVRVASDRVEDLRSDNTQELIQRFMADAHVAIDAFVNLVALVPDMVNQLAETTNATRASDKPDASQ